LSGTLIGGYGSGNVHEIQHRRNVWNWGCTVTGWLSIQIKMQALTADRRLFNDQRNDLS
jgi:hypothetical protein